MRGSSTTCLKASTSANESLSTTSTPHQQNAILFRVPSADPWYMTTVGLAILVVVAVVILSCLLILAACCCYFRSKKDSCSYELAAAMQLPPKSEAHQVQREFYV